MPCETLQGVLVTGGFTVLLCMMVSASIFELLDFFGPGRLSGTATVTDKHVLHCRYGGRRWYLTIDKDGLKDDFSAPEALYSATTVGDEVLIEYFIGRVSKTLTVEDVRQVKTASAEKDVSL